MSLIGQVNNMLRMPEVARFLGYEPNRSGFIQSPFKQEKTASCKLYDKLGAGFCDFSTGESGDVVSFVAKTQGVNNWEAMKMLIAAFSLPVDTDNVHLTKKKMQEIKQKREANQKRKTVEQKKWVAEMDSLKTIIRTCEDILISEHVQPLTGLWCIAVEQRNKAIVRANELVGIETTAEDLRLPLRQDMKAG